MVNPSHFGRVLWKIIFEYVFTYINEIEKVKAFIRLVCDILPCEKCKIHFEQIIIINNVMSSNNINYIIEFLIWVYNLKHKNKISYLAS